MSEQNKSLGEKIKEIRIKENLSQEALAKELGYKSKSTINKIEKGINEISYDKLMLLVKKYELTLDRMFENNILDDFNPINEESNLYVSFSARDGGNCECIVKYLIKDKDTFISFKNLHYNSCNKCEYECMSINKCKYREDDVYSFLEKSIKYKKIIFIVPMYCNNPSSLYFILSERMQDFFNNNESQYQKFIDKLHIIGIYGSSEESPLFIPVLSGWFNSDDKVLGIERHKIKSKMSDKITNNNNVLEKLNEYQQKWKL